MIGRRVRPTALLGVFACTLTLMGCGDGNPTGVPFVELGRDLAGVYSPSAITADLNMVLVLGTRHTVSGRYETGSGESRFEGTWQRDGDLLILTLPAQEGLPAMIELRITKEQTLTEIVPGPFSQQPENAPLFTEKNIIRLSGTAVVAGVQVEFNLIRVLTDVTGGGSGGQTRS